MDNPSVVVGHLSDEEIKKSIDAIVKTVDDGAQLMAKKFDDQIKVMEQSFNRLKNLKVDFGESSGRSGKSASSKTKQETQAVKEQTQAVKEQTQSYDALAQAQQKAVGAKSARESYIAFMQGYKAQGEAIAKQIQDAESALNKAVETRTTELTTKLDAAKRKLNELYSTLYAEQEKARNAGTLGMPYNAGITRTVQSIEYAKKHIAELQEKIANVPKEFRGQVDVIEQLRQKREQVLNTMKEEVVEQKKATVAEREIAQNSEIKANAAAKEKEELIKAWEAEQQKRAEQQKAYDIQNERNRQLEMENAKTAENLAFQERINAARQAKQGNEGKRVRETNELTGAIAGLLGIQEREVAVVDVESASQHRLTNYLHQLRSAYQRLDKEGMSASHGKMLADEIQRVSRSIAEMQKQASRPTSLKNALNLDETTLDNIAYKIQQLNSYKMGLKLTDPNQVAEMQKVDDAVSRLKKDYDNLMAKNSQLMSSNNALARSWNYMKNRLAFYFTVGASTAFVKNLIEIRSQYEMNERALGILIGSAERGTQIFNELSQMALVSPSTLIEFSNAARQLSAYDVAAKDVVDTTRRMADIAAAVGIPMERLTYALGQIKAYGYLNSRDARMFLNAGIPLVKSLADHYTQLEGKMVSVGDVYDRIKKKAVDYTDVMQVINEMTDENGRFFDFQAKMADTLKVQLANLTLAWNNMLNDIGESEQGVLVDMIKGLKEFMLQWKNVKTAIVSVGLGALIANIIKVTIAYRAAAAATGDFSKAQVLANLTSQKFVTTLQSMKSGLVALATSPYTWIAVAIAMFAELGLTTWKARESTVELNNSIINGANERVKSINDTVSELSKLYKFTRDANGDITGVTNINKEDAEKAWNTIREEIEMASSSSADFIYKLEAIEDVNSRIATGFKYLQEIQKAQDALSNLDDDAIDVNYEYSGLWNFYRMSDGLVQNFKDMEKSSQGIEESWADIGKHALQGFGYGGIIGGLLSTLWNKTHDSAESDKEKFMSDLQDTTNSIINAMKKAGVEGTIAQNEFYRASIDKILEKTDFTEKQKLKFRIAAEEQYYTTRLALMQQAVEREEGDYKAAAQRELNDFIAFHQKRNGYVQEFEHWVRRTQISELQKRFAQMSNEEMKHLDFSKGEWGAWVSDMAKKFAEQHNLSFDTVFSNLKSYLAQDWVLYIKTVVQNPDEKAIYDVLSEADKTIDEAIQKIERLKRRQSELRNQGASGVGTTEKDSEYLKVVNEIKEAEDELAEARAKGGHGKKEEKNEAKERKQAESELMKALKEELSLIDNIRNNYKKLTKEGETHTEAIERAVSGYDKTVNGINKVLQKYGVNSFNPSDYAGVEDPNQLVALLEKQITALISSGLAKTSEIKDLEVKIQSLKVEARSYNLKKVTDGLNNELSKLKDEYELALELDADPILGEVFKEMFNIDPSGFPNSIDDYMDKVQGVFDSERVKNGYMQTLNVFKASEQDWKDWAESVGISEEALKSFSSKFIEAQGVAKKWAQDIVSNTKKLEYDLAELNEKIAIKEKEQARLHEQIENEKNEVTKHYLELTYQNNQKAIDELKSQALSLMPEYARVFNSIAEHSAGVARRLQRDLMKVYESAIFDSASNSWTLTSSNGTQTKLSDTQYRKEREKLTKEMRKSQSNFQKIKEAFKPSDKDGVVDYAKGLELIAEEAKKAADGVHTIADIVAALGGSEDAVEVLNDVATSMEGVGTAMQGYAKIQSGDVIGGAADMIKGTWSAVSTWLDNGNKKIDREIKKSENAVKDLELAYKNLERTVEKAYGTAVIGAQKVAIANKEAQLAEVKRQLKLEESRDSKHRDENRIRELRAEIIDLENEIADKTDQIVNDLLGISSVGDAMESLMDGFVEALRSGEDAMKVFDESVDDMIANMVKKMFTTKILTPWFEQQWETIQKEVDERGSDEAKKVARIKEEASKWSLTGDGYAYFNRASGDPIYRELKQRLMASKRMEGFYATESDIRKTYDEMLRDAETALAQATTPTTEDIEKFAELLRSGQPIMEGSIDEIKELLVRLGLMKDSANKNLSALQQGIQGVTENTAGAIEAYMNSVSQQVYLHSDLLTQIRDAVVAMDSDAQLGVQAQMLLQLQQSYAIQVAIQGILAGWSNPSGLAVRVEMV